MIICKIYLQKYLLFFRSFSFSSLRTDIFVVRFLLIMFAQCPLRTWLFVSIDDVSAINGGEFISIVDFKRGLPFFTDVNVGSLFVFVFWMMRPKSWLFLDVLLPLCIDSGVRQELSSFEILELDCGRIEGDFSNVTKAWSNSNWWSVFWGLLNQNKPIRLILNLPRINQTIYPST